MNILRTGNAQLDRMQQQTADELVAALAEVIRNIPPEAPVTLFAETFPKLVTVVPDFERTLVVPPQQNWL